jgi:hypothetical protein
MCDILPIDRPLSVGALVQRNFFTAGRAGSIEKDFKSRHDEL